MHCSQQDLQLRRRGGVGEPLGLLDGASEAVSYILYS